MGRKKLSDDIPIEPRGRTIEERENQMIALAVDLAEQQLRDGTASSQVITHYLKLGSTKEKLEKELLATQIREHSNKADSYDDAKDIKALYAEAIAAFAIYNGTNNEGR